MDTLLKAFLITLLLLNITSCTTGTSSSNTQIKLNPVPRSAASDDVEEQRVVEKIYQLYPQEITDSKTKRKHRQHTPHIPRDERQDSNLIDDGTSHIIKNRELILQGRRNNTDITRPNIQ